MWFFLYFNPLISFILLIELSVVPLLSPSQGIQCNLLKHMGGGQDIFI